MSIKFLVHIRMGLCYHIYFCFTLLLYCVHHQVTQLKLFSKNAA